MRNHSLGGLVRLLSLCAATASITSIAPAASPRAGECVVTDTMAVVFIAGTPKSEINRIVSKIRLKERMNRTSYTNLDYEANARWTLTAYGATGAIGTPVHYTYSFVPDGTDVPDTGLGGGPSQLFAKFNQQFGSQALWQQKFQQMFDEWGNVSGSLYTQVSDDGAPLHFYPGQLGMRGDLRISCIPMTEPSVLAYNFFPDTGDMVINANWNWGDPGQDYRFFRNTTAHEHGHGMGLGHVMPMDSTKLMEPVLATAFDGPQNDDIQGCQFLYGDRVEDNDDIAFATDLGTASPGMTVDLLAVERPSDRDWFLVGIPEDSSLTVTVEPVGTAYMVGAQGGPPPVLRDNRRINDLRISAYQSDGTTLIGTSNSAGIGFPETLDGIARPSNGVVSLKVDVSTFANDIQRYRLVFSLNAATTAIPPSSLSIIRGIVSSGNLASIQASDDNRLKMQPGLFQALQTDPVEFEVSATSPNLNPPSLTFGYEGASSANGVRRKILLYDFDAQTWVEIDSAQGPTVEQTFEFNLTNPGRFIDAGGNMKARISCRTTQPVLVFPWESSTDYIYWRVGQ